VVGTQTLYECSHQCRTYIWLGDKRGGKELPDIFSRCEKLLKKEPLPPPPKLPTTRDELMEARLRVKRENRERALKAAATRARKKPGRQLRDSR